MIQARKVPLPRERRKEYSKPKHKSDYRFKLKDISIGNFHLYGILLACIILAVATVAQYCKIVTTNFEIGQAENRIEMLLEEKRKLEMDIAGLNSLVRIEDIARNELAMEEARELQIYTASRVTQ